MYSLECKYAFLKRTEISTGNVYILNRIRSVTRVDSENIMCVGRYNDAINININDVSNFINIDEILTLLKGE